MRQDNTFVGPILYQIRMPTIDTMQHWCCQEFCRMLISGRSLRHSANRTPCHRLDRKGDIAVSQEDIQRAVVVPEASNASSIADGADMWYKVGPIRSVTLKSRGRLSQFRKCGHLWERICSGSKNAFLLKPDRRRAQRGGDFGMQRACNVLVTSGSAFALTLRNCGTHTRRFR